MQYLSASNYLILVLLLGFLLFGWFITTEAALRHPPMPLPLPLQDITESFAGSSKVAQYKRPFLNIYDDTGVAISVVFITHPFTNPESIKEYEKAAADGIKFIGMSSYCEFPGLVSNPHDVLHNPAHPAWKWDYFKLVTGWCHCFRYPYQYIPHNIPKALISESDFPNHSFHLPDDTITKEYDFIYICLKDNNKCTDGWQAYNRNWDQAQKWLAVMCDKYKLRGLLIGRVNCKIPASCHNLFELTDFQEYNKFVSNFNKCRFIFAPNIADASPRVITEAMCYNLPIFVNYDILGGWKYVTSASGATFTTATFTTDLQRFLIALPSYTPRSWLLEHYCEEHSGVRLLQFVRECCPELSEKLKTVKWLKPGV